MIFYLNKKSLLNRKFTTLISVLSIALCVSLFVGLEKVREGVKAGFTGTLSGTDLVVGAKGGSLQLLLYTVFHMGSPAANIRYSSYQEIKNNSAVKWVIPISLGDNYRGYRVVGTNDSFFRHYRFRGDQRFQFATGKFSGSLYGVVLGAEVAEKLGHKIGDSLIVTHGLSEGGTLNHDKTPFVVEGILKKSHTPVDRSVILTLEGVEAMHIGWENGYPSYDDSVVAPKSAKEIEVKQITSMLVGAKNRIFALRLSSQISQFQGEPLMAVMPGIVLAELWQIVGNIEQVLFLMSLCILLIGLLGILISLYSTLGERRREMAILRSLGVSGFQVAGLLISESFLLVLSGTLIGALGCYAGLWFFQKPLEMTFGVFIQSMSPTSTELVFYGSVWGMGILMGLIPALSAYKMSLKDGLSIKV